ncbi:receptor-like protein kinase FERONIA [Lactuca sativa]|uniref:receptor-like protein kinase FERONIA n=1 Tax=Lactuca sativa TaxID=4236 RepID=UPI000CD8A5CB|nr:receptor-like protein kinase FERONIA [Lactuca sativa]
MFSATDDLNQSQPSTFSSIESSRPCRYFEFHEILLATANFDESLVIGKGGFGKVYKGNIINGPSLVVAAIKRLDSMSTQGVTEFWAEVEMLSKLRHCHLVSLFGYCNHEKEKILIYEYMPNGTLEDHLHKLGTSLSWLQRLKICISAARGLDYLHTGTGIDVGVIHRDIKSSNILLHESWAAKISDFGLSRIGPTNQPSTYVNTLVKGTFGYLDPNYFTTGRLTRKSDVYAFGVILLEVLCRKRAVDRSLDEEQWGLVAWAQSSIKEGNLKSIIDCDIRGEISTKCLKEFVRIVERCLLSNPKQRPTMAEVVVSLDSLMTLQEKTNTSLQAANKTIFGKVLDMFPSTSNRENSARGDSKLSSKGYNRNTRLIVYKFKDLKRATRHFSQDLLLDMGDCGEVFLGWVNSTEGVEVAVAVKRYTPADHEIHLQRWQTEVNILGGLAHRNIICLLGYCDDKKNEHLLVYEFMKHSNLRQFLSGGDDVSKQLPWAIRVKIMVGVARGLAYMHSFVGQVIHRDVKSAKILLDEHFNAQLAGFGSARFFPEIGRIDVTTRVMGSLGYLDPEYLSTGRVSLGSDIYSFGVVLLEILTGQQAISFDLPEHQRNLATWARSYLADTTELKKIMDPRLEQNYSFKDAFECATLASRCIAEVSKDRPSSAEVWHTLERIYGN